MWPFTLNRDYGAYLTLWEHRTTYLEPIFAFVFYGFKGLGFNFEIAFAILSLIPVFFLFKGFRSFGVGPLASGLAVASLFGPYDLGPIRQAIANSVLFYLISKSRQFNKLSFLTALIHWSCAIPILFYLVFRKFRPYIIILTISFLIVALYYVSNDPWFQTRGRVFLLHQSSYFSPTTALYRFFIFVLIVMSFRFDRFKLDEFYILLGCAVAFVVFLPIGLGQNLVQRAGMMFDVFWFIGLSRTLAIGRISDARYSFALALLVAKIMSTILYFS